MCLLSEYFLCYYSDDNASILAPIPSSTSLPPTAMPGGDILGDFCPKVWVWVWAVTQFYRI